MDVGDVHDLALPPMKANPFSTKPLEKDEYRLMVGRDSLYEELSRHLRYDSPRMVLLVGERGMGRTSFLHSLSMVAEEHLSFSLYPESEPATVLLNEMFCAISGFEVPATMTALVERLVTSVTSSGVGVLPLVTFDFPSATAEQLATTFGRLTPILGRLRAVTLVALTPDQLAGWPLELQEEYDIKRMETLGEDDVSSLIDRRMMTVTNQTWLPQEGLVDRVVEQTGGLPSKVVRLMRDLIDKERDVVEINQKMYEFWMSMDVHKVEGGSTTHPTGGAGRNDVLIPDERAAALGASFESHPQTKSAGEEISLSKGQGTRLNSSESKPMMPDDRRSVEIPSNKASKNVPTMPAEPSPNSGNMIIAPPSSSLPAGGLGGLAGRNRENRLAPTPPLGVDDARIIVADGSNSDQSSTDITHQPNPPNPLHGIDAPHQISPQFNQERVLRTEYNQNPPSNSAEGTTDFSRLATLNEGELAVVKAAQGREISPSDNELQEGLGVGRARLSQICNSLKKAGILKVQNSGRNRFFTLTSEAAARLLLKEDDEGVALT